MFQPHAFFYQSHPVVVDRHAPVENTPAIFVYKENKHYTFTGKIKIAWIHRIYKKIEKH